MERAALNLAVSAVSPIFELLGAKAAPFFGGDITEELQHLQNIILLKIRTVLKVADAVPVHELKPWLRTLQDAAYEAEFVLDLYEYKRPQAAHVSSLPDPLKKLKKKAKEYIFSNLPFKTELKKSMEKLRQCADEGDKLIFRYGAVREVEMWKGTLDALCLSFANLAPHLRRCFAFCSLYPKGYHFEQDEVDRLVRFWIAQDFVEVSDNNMTIEDKGMQYFNELLSHSFFQKAIDSYDEYYYVIRDLMHDLAEGVSKDHCYRIDDDTLHIPPAVMHLSISRKKDLSSNIKSEIFKLLNLHTFIINEISEADFNSIFGARSKIFYKFEKLRVLHLGDHGMSELHKSVCQLKHLRYFQLRGVDRLPESLKIRGYNDVELPKWLLNDGGVSNPQFSRLSTLSVGNCPELKQVPSLPSTLKTVVIERCKNLCEASSLPRDLRVVRVIQCPKLMQLCPFPPNLEHLVIEGCPGVETLLADVLLFDSRDEQLQQHHEKEQLQLKILSIKSCTVSDGKKRHFGSRNNKLSSSLFTVTLWDLPWLASLLLPDRNFTSLEVVRILKCESLELFGSSLASASSLKWLHVMGCPKLIVEGGEPLLLPPSLQYLTIDDLSLLRRSPCLNSLRSLTIHGCREGIIAFTREQEELFPHLTSLIRLYIDDCPNLTSLPASLEKLSSLRKLMIYRCPKIESLPNLPASLEWLIIERCPEIESLPNLPTASLHYLSIKGCPKIESLPNLPASLALLGIGDCHPQLKVSYGEGGPLRHKVQHIPHLYIRS